PAALAERRGVFAEESEIVGRVLERALEPFDRGADTLRVAQQLAAEFERARVRGVDRHGSLSGLHGEVVLAVRIAKPADIDPQPRARGRPGEREIERPRSSRNIAFLPFEPRQCMEAALRAL